MKQSVCIDANNTRNKNTKANKDKDISLDIMFPNIYTVSGKKKRPRYFQLQLSHSLVDFIIFVPLETGINIPQSHVIYLLKIFMTS